MGCGGSKLEEEAAVAHCRERSVLLAKAIRHRYDLADAHAAYARSLQSVGDALHDFLRGLHSLPPPPPSPLLHLPAQRKGDPLPPLSPSPAPAAAASASVSAAAAPPQTRGGHADDGGHIPFHSDDSDDTDDGGHIHFQNSDDEAPGAPATAAPTYPSGYGAAAPIYASGYGTGAPTYPSGYGTGAPTYPSGYGAAAPTYTSGYGTAAPDYPSGYGAGATHGSGSGYGYGGGGGGGGGEYASGYGDGGGYGSSFNISYARSQPPPPSVSYEQRPPGSETASVHYFSGGGGGAAPYYGYPYQPQSSNIYQNPYGYGGEMSGYYGSASPPPGYAAPPAAAAPSSSRAAPAPPPPPSPPRVSTWDFLNPFESYESYYEQPPAPYTPSRSSKEVREEEGIPDLEDEEQEVVKEAYGDQKFPGSISAASKEYAGKGKAAKEEGEMEDSHRKSKSSEASSSGGLEHEVHVVEKSVVGDQVQRPEDRRHVAGVSATAAAVKTYHDDAEVVQEIKAQFDRASGSANEICKMLEVGKMPYYQKKSAYKVSVMMICGLPSTNDEFLRFEEDKAMGCGNLSSTLQKLYMWEKKLLEEVKTGEKLRVLYDQKREELKLLDERGAEADKLEATEVYIRKLSTKISIAIKVVNTISNKISRLRDDELWPETCELIQGLMQMWGIMLECHEIQLHAISEAKNIDSIISAAKFSDTHLDAIKRLELELLDWIGSFSVWVNAQKSYVRTLNEWLRKGVNYEPEVTDDGIPPFSPGRLGAPPIFVIYNHWANSMDRISEKEVVDAMQDFATNVLHLWERHKFEQRQSLMANKGMDRDIRVMERDEQSMRKALELQNKKLVPVSGHKGVSLSAQVLHEGPSAEVGSLQSSLRNIFEAMLNFTSATAKSYEDLHSRSEEEKVRLAQENGRVP